MIVKVLYDSGMQGYSWLENSSFDENYGKVIAWRVLNNSDLVDEETIRNFKNIN